MRRIYLVVLGLTTMGCAGSQMDRQAYLPFQDNPCPGRGELYYRGLPGSDLPVHATVVRRVDQRGDVGFCYTTPESIAAAQPS